MTGFSLAELARRAGVSARTVRYYIQRGLLRAPEFRGPDTQYDEDHLLHLQAIRALQEAHYPLDAIAASLQTKSAEQLKAIARGLLPKLAGRTEAAPAPVPVSASQLREPAAVSGTRYSLAEGLELWLTDDASPAVRRLGDAIRTFASERLQTRKGGER